MLTSMHHHHFRVPVVSVSVLLSACSDSADTTQTEVVGFEIENTIGADIYGNIAKNNTGGVLVFNMLDLPQEGHSTRVFGNKAIANNTGKFGAEGTPVASAPAGSGIVINSNDKVEIFDNDIAANNTANINISSYYSTFGSLTMKVG